MYVMKEFLEVSSKNKTLRLAGEPDEGAALYRKEACSSLALLPKLPENIYPYLVRLVAEARRADLPYWQCLCLYLLGKI
jgi:hypothetical protein